MFGLAMRGRTGTGHMGNLRADLFPLENEEKSVLLKNQVLRFPLRAENFMADFYRRCEPPAGSSADVMI